MRHLGQVSYHDLTADITADCHSNSGRMLLKRFRLNQFPETNHRILLIGNLNTDCRLTRNGGLNTDIRSCKCQLDVILQRHNTAHLHTRLGFQFITGNGRPYGNHAHIDLYAEALERIIQLFLNFPVCSAQAAAECRIAFQQIGRRKYIWLSHNRFLFRVFRFAAESYCSGTAAAAGAGILLPDSAGGISFLFRFAFCFGSAPHHRAVLRQNYMLCKINSTLTCIRKAISILRFIRLCRFVRIIEKFFPGGCSLFCKIRKILKTAVFFAIQICFRTTVCFLSFSNAVRYDSFLRIVRYGFRRRICILCIRPVFRCQTIINDKIINGTGNCRRFLLKKITKSHLLQRSEIPFQNDLPRCRTRFFHPGYRQIRSVSGGQYSMRC